MTNEGRVLIVGRDDHFSIRSGGALVEQGYHARWTGTGNEALAILAEEGCDVLIAGETLPDTDGLALLDAACQRDPSIVGVLVEDRHAPSGRVDIPRNRVSASLNGPLEPATLLPLLQLATEIHRLRQETERLKLALRVQEKGFELALNDSTEQAIEALAQGVAEVLRTEEVSVMEPTEDGLALRVVVALGKERDRLLGRTVPMGPGDAGGMASELTPALPPSTADSPIPAHLHPQAGIKSSISVPISNEGRLLAVLNVAFTSEDQSLHLARLEALAVLVRLAGQAIEQARIRQERRTAAEEHGLLVSRSPSGVFQLAPDGRIVSANPAMANLLGYPSLEALYEDRPLVQDLVTVNSRQHWRDLALLAGKVGGITGIQVEIQRKDGRREWLSVSGTAVRDAKGRVVCWEGIAENITQQKRAEARTARTVSQLRSVVQAVMETIARITEMRDPYTAGHQRRVANLAGAIAVALELSGSQVEGIRTAVGIHDVGKVAIPGEILSRPGHLTGAELELIRRHPRLAADLIAPVGFPWPVAEMILQHHERMDGSGYPSGLRGEEILLGARIIAVADVVEAMSSHRPYRPALGIERAVEEIRLHRGTLYDPAVVDACIRVLVEDGFLFE